MKVLLMLQVLDRVSKLIYQNSGTIETFFKLLVFLVMVKVVFWFFGMETNVYKLSQKTTGAKEKIKNSKTASNISDLYRSAVERVNKKK